MVVIGGVLVIVWWLIAASEGSKGFSSGRDFSESLASIRERRVGAGGSLEKGRRWLGGAIFV